MVKRLNRSDFTRKRERERERERGEREGEIHFAIAFQ